VLPDLYIVEALVLLLSQWRAISRL
jgi:hypothetical protein